MIEFVEDGHIYLYDGVIVPSVSELIKFELNEYKDVPQWILQRAADYGTRVHDAIELFEQGFFIETEDPNVNSAVREFIKIKEDNGLKIAEMEKMVGNSHVCGRFDIRLENGEIVDIKTNSRLPKRHLEIQLGFYNYLDGVEREKGHAIWIPKGQFGEYIEVKPITNKECEDIIARYEKRDSK